MSVSKHYTPTQGYSHLLEPGEFGINNLHFGILNLSTDSSYFDHSDDCELALIALGGIGRLLVGHNGNKANGVLGKRADVFGGDACVAYIPHHTTYEVITTTNNIEIAICKTPSHLDSAAAIYDAGDYREDNDYRINISENTFKSECIGEGLCHYRFLDTQKTATVQLIESEKNTARVILQDNDLLVLNEKTRARLLEYGDDIYQLSIHLQ